MPYSSKQMPMQPVLMGAMGSAYLAKMVGQKKAREDILFRRNYLR